MPVGPGVLQPAIRTLLLCDLVASTQWVERVGDRAAADLLSRHDRVARDLLPRFNGREIDKSDGFLLLFERPVEAVLFALAYRDGLRDLGGPAGSAMTCRVGIHLGEVLLRDNTPADIARGAKPVEVEGLAKAIAARVMSLAGPGRILLTRAAYDFARRAVVGDESQAPLRWAVHGSYRLVGVDDPVEIGEVAEPGQDSLVPPPDTEKAWREAIAERRTRTTALASPSRATRRETDAEQAEPIVAVLAFDNLSSDPEMQFFSDGVSEEIIQRLSRGAHLKVIGRTSSFQFRGDRKAEVAGHLGCSHVLDGSIRRAAGRVRISAHLIEASSRTTLWSDRFDRGIEDIFAVQDEISEHIAEALHRTFSRVSPGAVDPATYDLYLRSSPSSYSPDELRRQIGLLEVVTARAPDFVEAWGRLASLRAFLHQYVPYVDRAASAERVEGEAARALSLDPQNVEAAIAQLLVVPPFGRFVAGDAILERIRSGPGSGGRHWGVGWYLRSMGRIRESLEETERAHRLDALDPMSTNLLALARMAAGRVGEAVPLFEALVARIPEMSFPVANLLRAHAFLQDWDAVDRLLDLATKRQLREFESGLDFIRAKRDPSPERIAGIRSGFLSHVERTGCVDVSRLVYAAHLGLVEEAHHAAEHARLGPSGTADDMLGPDAYRPALLFQAGMPEIREDRRFPRLCARLGLVEFWTTTGKWPDCADEVPYDFRAECAKVRDVPIADFGF